MENNNNTNVISVSSFLQFSDQLRNHTNNLANVSLNDSIWSVNNWNYNKRLPEGRRNFDILVGGNLKTTNNTYPHINNTSPYNSFPPSTDNDFKQKSPAFSTDINKFNNAPADFGSFVNYSGFDWKIGSGLGSGSSIGLEKNTVPGFVNGGFNKKIYDYQWKSPVGNQFIADNNTTSTFNNNQLINHNLNFKGQQSYYKSFHLKNEFIEDHQRSQIHGQQHFGIGKKRNNNNKEEIEKEDQQKGTTVEKRFKTLPPAEALPKNEKIGGYIFVCNNDAMEENLRRQLFERYVSVLLHHPEIANYLDHSGKREVLDRATRIGAVDVVKTILNIDIANSYPLLIPHGIYNLYNLLYIAAKRGYLEISCLLLVAFNKSRERQAQKEREEGVRSNLESAAATPSLLSFQPLWSLPHEIGETPLAVAFGNRHRKLAVDMLYSEFALLSDLVDIYDEKPTIIPAMEQPDFKAYIEGHMKQDGDKTWIMDVYVKAFLRFLRKNTDDNSRKLIKQLPELIQFKDASGRSMLQYLVDENDVDRMCLLLKIHPPDGEHEHLLIRACRKGKLSAIRAICDLFPNCPQAAICHDDQTTVLHNVRLQDLKEYRSLLNIPEIARLKNKIDRLDRTPLIKAIQENNVYLAQALFDMDGIDEVKTAAVLFKVKSKESVEWDALYKKAMQATSYIPRGTDLKEMRSTLSIVAALLATITFAAAFTIPGGFDQNNGDVLLGQRASFIVFILSDNYAMCCSMIVLYSLIWSMVLDSKKALQLIDRSVFVLLQSLYGTLVAFMTGVYTMMSHKTLWVAIIICVISSCVPILANRRILITVLDKSVPMLRPRSNIELEEISIQR